MSARQKIAALGLAAALSLVATWEGIKTTAYQDIVGIWTVCYGYTHGVKQGDQYTPAQCEDKLVSELVATYSAIRPCIHVSLTKGERAAAVSLAYNAGADAVCRSGFVRKLNARDPKACDELLRWVYAGGKYSQGLANRRKAERKVCSA